jgi:peptidyl-prolyl cis-trans isomerase B (cyclophilin B)
MAALASTCRKNENVKVLLETGEGNIVIQLYDETPLHRDNFVKLAKQGYFDGVLFHRVIEHFMIQTGDPETKNPIPDAQYGAGGPDYTIPAEFVPEKYHKTGAVAAARTDNPQKASSGSQFYIVQGRIFDAEALSKLEERRQMSNPSFKFSPEAAQAYATVGGTPHLDGEYTVFGEVLEGLDVVDKIAASPTNPADRPLKDVFINRVTIIK